VMCIHEESNRPDEPVSSYERGARRPLFRGSTSKVILAYLPPRALSDLWQSHRREIIAAGLGASYEDFKATLQEIRKDGVRVSAGEVDPGRIGISAPLFDAHGRIIGSLSIVLMSPRANDTAIARLCTSVINAAREIERRRDDKGARGASRKIRTSIPAKISA